ncbi:MAG: TIGR01777 family oxidoreductase [Flavobacteriales bacterium]
MKTIVIAGASGFVGGHLSRHFESIGWKVKTIGRKRCDGTWDNPSSLVQVLEGADAVVNLAGKSVNCRFTKSNVEELVRSRVETTRAIGDAVVQCKTPPPVWINASGASIYREQVDEANTEKSATDGEGTMAEVARRWEEAFFGCSCANVRKVALRITLVLGDDGGVWPIYKRLARWGLGGRQGSGRQMMSWIHVDDLCRLVQHCATTPQVEGPVNAAAPGSVSNRDFMSAVLAAVGVKWGYPASAFEINMGTSILGIPGELILRGMWVKNEQASIAGFSYSLPTLSDVINAQTS